LIEKLHWQVDGAEISKVFFPRLKRATCPINLPIQPGKSRTVKSRLPFPALYLRLFFCSNRNSRWVSAKVWNVAKKTRSSIVARNSVSRPVQINEMHNVTVTGIDFLWPKWLMTKTVGCANGSKVTKCRVAILYSRAGQWRATRTREQRERICSTCRRLVLTDSVSLFFRLWPFFFVYWYWLA
jgi:hypothetical protein